MDVFRSYHASHTLISGKVNEVMDLFVRKIDPPARGRNQGRVEYEPPPWAGRFCICHRAFDAAQD